MDPMDPTVTPTPGPATRPLPDEREGLWVPLIEGVLRAMWGGFGEAHQDKWGDEVQVRVRHGSGNRLFGHGHLKYRDTPTTRLDVEYRERIPATVFTLRVVSTEQDAPIYSVSFTVTDREYAMSHHLPVVGRRLATEMAPHVYHLDPRRGIPLYVRSKQRPHVSPLLPLPLFDRPDGSHRYQTELLLGVWRSGLAVADLSDHSPTRCPFCGESLLDPTHRVIPVWGGGNLGWVHPGCMDRRSE